MTAGTRLGRYELLRLLGRGGMAEVYLARQFGPDGFEKPCVLKRINPESEKDPTHRILFLEEARLCGILNHPFIVQTFDYGEADGVPFMAMELVEGMNLASLLRRMRERRDRIPMRAGVELGQAMLEALGYAHRLQVGGRPLGVVHRDVSPANILLSRQGIAKLSDFGVARKDRPDEATIGARVKGKLGYMSPEQARGEALDGRADLFSLGIVLTEVLSGQKVSEGPIPVGLDRYRPRVEALLGERADLPKSVKSLVLWLVAERADERPPDAESAADLLRRLVDELPARENLARFLPVAIEQYRASDEPEVSSSAKPASTLERTHVDLPGRIPSSLALSISTDLGSFLDDGRKSKEPEPAPASDWLIPGDKMNRAENLKASMPPSQAALRRSESAPAVQGWNSILGEDAAGRISEPISESTDSRPWMAPSGPPSAALAASGGPTPTGLPIPRATTGSAPLAPGLPLSPPAPLASSGAAPEGQAVDRLRGMFGSRPAEPESPVVVRALLAVAALGAIVALVLFTRAGVFSFEKSAAMSGKLLVESDPPGAEVWIDGASKGVVTPAELNELPVERALVLEVKKAGFLPRPERLVVEIPNDEFKSSRAKFTLTPAKSLQLVSNPPGAQVSLDGRRLAGRTPLTLPDLSDGQKVTLEVTLEEYLPATLALDIGADTATVTEVTLQRATSFDVDVDPSGAMVFLDDAEVGRAPLYGLLVPADRKFRLRAEAGGYKSQEKKIDPRRTTERRIELKLSALPFSALPIPPEDRKRIKVLEAKVVKLAQQVRFAETKLQDREATYERVSARRGVSSAEMTAAISELESARARLGNLERQLEETREELNAIKFELSERNRIR